MYRPCIVQQYSASSSELDYPKVGQVLKILHPLNLYEFSFPESVLTRICTLQVLRCGMSAASTEVENVLACCL